MATVNKINEISKKYNLPKDIVELALANIDSNKALILGVSGKIGSGKDTVAPLILRNLNQTNTVHDYFARPLKNEASAIIAIANNSETIEDAAILVESNLNVTKDEALRALSFIWDEAKAKIITTGYDRTEKTRGLLQYWGTEVRRSHDDNYWVKLTLKSMFHALAEGKTVFVTDARFPNEIDALADCGAYTLRLKVSEAMQNERIVSRDGIEMSQNARNHISETALDSYEKNEQFYVIVDTDSIDAEQVALIVSNKIKETIHD